MLHAPSSTMPAVLQELDAIKQEAKLLQKQLDEVRFMMHEAGVPCNCSSMSGRSERLECCACLICPLHVQLEQVRALRIKQQDEAILRDVRKAVTAMEEVADSVDARRAQVPLQCFPGQNLTYATGCKAVGHVAHLMSARTC